MVCVARHIWTELFLTHKDKLVQLTAIGEKLLKDLLERVFVYFAFGTLLFILLMVFFYNIFFILSCLKPLYIFLISCLLNLVASTFTRNVKEENTSFGVRYQLQLIKQRVKYDNCLKLLVLPVPPGR